MLSNHIQVEVPYSVLHLLAIEAVQHARHSLAKRVHIAYFEELGFVAHHALCDILHQVWVHRTIHIFNLPDRRINSLHQFLQREHIVHESLRSHIAMTVQGMMVSIQSGSCIWCRAVVYLSVCCLQPFLAAHALEVMALAVVVIQLAALNLRVLRLLMLYLPPHSLSSHLPQRAVAMLLHILRQPQHILHVLHVRRNSVAYLMQGICHLILNVVPESRLTLSVLCALGDKLLNSVIESKVIHVHLFLHISSQLSIDRIIQVHPKTSHIVIELISKQTSHALVSYSLVPNGFLSGIRVMDVRHIQMHLARILVIPASHLLAVLYVLAHLRVLNLVNRVHHLHLTASLLRYFLHSLSNPAFQWL